MAEILLTPLQFGIPNSRLRYYLLAKQRPLKFAYDTLLSPDSILRHIPGTIDDWVDNREANGDPKVQQIRTYLDAESNMLYENHPCRIPDKVLAKWGRLFDIVLPDSRRSCCFTRGEYIVEIS